MNPDCQKIPLRPITASAPGCLDFLGGWAAPHGGQTLKFPTEARTFVNLYGIENQEICLSIEEEESAVRFALPSLRHAWRHRVPLPEFQTHPAACPPPDWAREALSHFHLFCLRQKWFPATGLYFQFYSDTPPDLGVGRREAQGLALLLALSQLSGRAFTFPQAQQILLETKPRHLFSLNCSSSKNSAPIKWPKDLLLAAWPSGVALPMESSANALIAAQFGQKLWEKQLRRTWKNVAGISPELYARHASTALPEKMSGRQISKLFSTEKIAGATIYPVRAAFGFVIEENVRCEVAWNLMRLMKAQLDEETATNLGRLLLQSHEQATHTGRGTREADQMIDALMDRGPRRGIYGARLSGGSGTVVVLLRRSALGTLQRLRRRLYFAPEGSWPLIF